MSEKSFHKVIFRNSFINTLRYFINYAIIFVLTPIIISGIGDAQYGLWALIFSLIGYAGLLDLGVQQATIKLVAEYKGKNDILKLNQIISTTLFYFFCIGCLAAFICWFILPLFMHYFIAESELIKLTGTLLVIVGFDVVFAFLGSVFTGISLGLHQYHFKGMIDICCGVLRLMCTIYVLDAGYGIIGLSWVALVLDIVAAIALYSVCLYTNTKMVLSYSLVSRMAFKEIFSFASKVFLATTAIRINASTIVVMISFFLNTKMTAYYSVANRLVGSVQEVIYSFTATLFPVFSELSVLSDKSVLAEYYMRYTRIFLIITIPATLSVYYFGSGFISLWINAEYAHSSESAIAYLSLCAFVAGLQPLSARLMIGSGDVNFYTKITVIKSLCILIASIPSIKVFGLSGPPFILFVSECIYQFVCLVYIVDYLDINIKNLFKMSYVPVFYPAMIVNAGFYMSSFLFGIQEYVGMVLNLTLIIAIYLAAIYFFSLNSHEKKFLLCWVNKWKNLFLS